MSIAAPASPDAEDLAQDLIRERLLQHVDRPVDQLPMPGLHVLLAEDLGALAQAPSTLPAAPAVPTLPGMVAIEDVDLARLAEDLRRYFWSDPPVGYLRGRTAFREAIVERLGCSEVEAETLVDTLEARGFLRFDGSPARRSEADAPWIIDVHGEA